MIINRAGVFGGILSLAIVLPLLSFVRFYPLPDWVSSGIALAFVCAGVVLALFQRVDGRLSIASIGVLAFAIFCLLQVSVDGMAFGLIFLFFFILLLYLPHYAEANFQVFIAVMASGLLLAALVQCILGWIQLLGLAPSMHGFVLFERSNPAGNVFGNIGQRNLYADFLMWGAISACYLFAVGRLNKALLGVCLAILALMVAWSGSRLSLAYVAGLVLLGWFWLRKAKENVVVRRMVAAVIGFVILSVCVQFFSHSLIQILHYLGLNIEAQSGSERILDAGFGARRRIEWTKAWDIFKAHPWFGVGFGGFSSLSTQMEAYAGLPKIPESWLFTHSHNLVFQLLAETGLVGTAIAIVGVLVPVCRFLRRGEQTAENLLLLGVAMVILVHSLFEYPLWYLPYLLMLCIACTLAPGRRYAQPVRASILKVVSVAAIVICVCYLAAGTIVFSTLVRYSVPPASPQARELAIKELSSVPNFPLWSWDVDMALANYIEPSKEQLPIKLQFFERLASYRPYPAVLVKLSVLQALNQQPKQAEATLRVAIANYPDYVPRFVPMLTSHPEPEVAPLRSRALVAAEAYGKLVPNMEQARLAAVMTAAEPVRRKPLF
ncbi:Wzy polymerase domain-containing protein [Chromobacterium haemolyticum]|uniref:Wzy polymerase domain-containing protein n=1 Tax=Chromobacterium haemolyticum TaxID=394935 RepID=UPI0040578098